jgi:alkylhydroperoxidase family enzyme
MALETHVRPVDRDRVADPALTEVLERAERTQSPPVTWYLTMGHNPEVARGFAEYWEMLHRGGTVPHEIKELCRIQIAQMVGCDFCARQRSPLADSITDEEVQSCALPDWEHPDPKTRAALHYARTLTLDDGRDTEVYAELEEHYTRAEIIEMAAFFCLTAGGNRMAHSWGIDPREESSVPEGVMSTHDPQTLTGKVRA